MLVEREFDAEEVLRNSDGEVIKFLDKMSFSMLYNDKDISEEEILKIPYKFLHKEGIPENVVVMPTNEWLKLREIILSGCNLTPKD